MMTKTREFAVVIDKIVYGGWGLGRFQGKVVFVPFSVPGDRLLVRPFQEKKKFIRAVISNILEPGPGRVAAPCIHFGKCGGCQWQNLEYDRQVEAKRRILEELFHHNFPTTRKLEIAMKPSEGIYEYRSRARLHTQTTEAGKIIGFHRFQADRVQDIEICPLFRPALNEALAAVRKWIHEGRSPVGASEIEIACSQETAVWGASFDRTGRGEAAFRQNGDIQEPPGPVALEMKIGNFTYEAPPSVFFQANDFMTADLVETVINLVGQGMHSSALDLYCGVGLFALPLARLFANVVAVDNSSRAARLCAKNAEIAGLPNLQVVCADVPKWMDAVGSVAPPGFDLIILDPPRQGAGPEVMRRLGEWAPETVLYVSCDPQTLSRDLSYLPTHAYEIESILGLDLFPHTYHFETVVLLRRR